MEGKFATNVLLGNMLSFLLRKLRHDLLMEYDTRRKIEICYSIFDCAYLIDNLRKLTSNTENISLSFSTLSEVAVISPPSSGQSIGSLLGLIDGATTGIRQGNFHLCSATRRFLVNVANLYKVGNVIPNHNPAATAQIEELPWPTVPSRPNRENDQNKDLVISRSDSCELTEKLHWQLFGIEINAAEICAAIPLRFPHLTWELDFVLANQTFEEGRHADLILHQLLERGGDIGSFAPCFKTWDKAFRAKTLEEALCIEQVLGEGYALGYDLMAVHEYELIGDHTLSEIHLSLHIDEMMHASDGIRFLKNSTTEDFGAMVERLKADFAVLPPPDPWFRPDLREAVGFSLSQIDRQREFRDNSSSISSH